MNWPESLSTNPGLTQPNRKISATQRGRIPHGGGPQVPALKFEVLSKPNQTPRGGMRPTGIWAKTAFAGPLPTAGGGFERASPVGSLFCSRFRHPKIIPLDDIQPAAPACRIPVECGARPKGTVQCGFVFRAETQNNVKMQSGFGDRVLPAEAKQKRTNQSKERKEPTCQS
jgi:hypothetical protein